MSCKEYAETFVKIAEKKGYQTLGFDLPEHGERTDGYNRCDIWNGIHDLNVIADYAFSKWNHVFQSPVVDMEYLIQQMFLWFQLTEERRSIPTAILYGGKDNMQSAEVVQNFVKKHECDLTISKDSKHAFMQDGDDRIIKKWLEKNI